MEVLPLAGGVGQPDMLLEQKRGGGCGDTRTGLPLMDWRCVWVCGRVHVWGSEIFHLQFNFTETFWATNKNDGYNSGYIQPYTFLQRLLICAINTFFVQTAKLLMGIRTCGSSAHHWMAFCAIEYNHCETIRAQLFIIHNHPIVFSAINHSF